jgi:hypothetical protein
MRLPAIKEQVTAGVFEDLLRACGPTERQRLTNGKYRAGGSGYFTGDVPTRTWADHKTGESGGVLDLLIYGHHARDYAEAADWLRSKGHLEADPERIKRNGDAAATDKADVAQERARKIEIARKAWRECRPLHPSTLASVYLAKARALPPPWPSSLAFAAKCYCGPVREKRAALLAAVAKLSAPDDVFAVQRIFLEPPGRKCTDLESPKMSLGPIAGGGVILGDVRDALVVAEGIESALSASRALGLPAVAVLGASNLTKLEIPDTITRVIIAPDRDEGGTGERHARALGVKLARRGVSVALAWAPDGLNDWNDWTMREAAKITEAAYAR